MTRIVGLIALAVALMTVLLMAADRVLDGFHLGGWMAALVAATCMTVVISVAWPFIFAVARMFGPWLFPILIFVLSGVLVLGAIALSNWAGAYIRVADLGTAVWLAVWLSGGMAVLSAVFSLDGDAGYDRMVLSPLEHAYANVPKSSDPGVFFLEIDGLSEPILRQALDAGHMPNLKSWLDSGEYALTGWEPDFSSQTSASQAGILLGDNTGIPAFRWWDKPSNSLMVSSKMQTAHVLEQRLSTGDGLLVNGGGSRWNAFSGDAPDCLCTFSTMGEKGRELSNAYLAWFANPFTLIRSLTLTLIDVGRERWQAWKQAHDKVEPRVHRGWKYAFTRAGTTTLMQEASRFVVAADMMRGVPSGYVTFFGYDEVAHHSGIDRPDVWGVLRNLDRDFAWLREVGRKGARPYEIVVLSDHGQSMGATFLQRYGMTLADLVGQLMENNARVTAVLDSRAESDGYLNVAVEQALDDSSRTGRLLRRVLNRQTEGGELSLGKAADVAGPSSASAESDAVVLASGNLGVISFPKHPNRMTLEQLSAAYPGLVKGLSKHPGISFALVETDEQGPVAIGADGIHYLRDGHVDGADPLAKFGPTAAGHLLRESAFPNCPDILVVSMFDPETLEVAAFEELVGNHGGLGGWQQRPFVLHPARLQPGPEPIVGTAALHRTLKGWLREVQGAAPLAGAKAT